MKNNIKLKKENDVFSVVVEDYTRYIKDFPITIPKGFRTDGASIPLVLRPFFERYGKNTEAAVIHDYLYSKFNDTGINRELADKIFLFILKENGVSWRVRNMMYKAVRMFGEVFWEKKLRNEGISIIENLTELGVPFPKAFTKFFKQLKQQDDDKKLD